MASLGESPKIGELCTTQDGFISPWEDNIQQEHFYGSLYTISEDTC